MRIVNRGIAIRNCDAFFTNASRTWVEVFGQGGTLFFSSCTFDAAIDLADLAFPLGAAQIPPDCVIVRLTDRLCGRVYESACMPLVLPQPRVEFRRGDCNDDDKVDISDGICILLWRFSGGSPPGCLAVADVNGDRDTDISDAIALFAWLFLGGPAPVAPFGQCGPATLPTDTCATPPGACR